MRPIVSSVSSWQRTAARRAARVAAVLLTLAVPLALGGCGNRNLVLNIDVLSYMDGSQTDFPFGPIPALPGGLATGEQNILPDADVNLFGNFGEVATVRAVSLRIAVVCETYSGAGSDTLRMYLSDPETDPRTTPAVLAQQLVFTPSQSDTVITEVAGDQRMLDLFSAKRLRMTITTSLRGPNSGAALSGHTQITGIDAVVVAGRKGT